MGLCIFGRSVTNTNTDFIINACNEAHGIELETAFFMQLGKETLELEAQFNKDAGFTEADDELPAFFYEEALPPSNKAARWHSGEVNETARALSAES